MFVLAENAPSRERPAVLSFLKSSSLPVAAKTLVGTGLELECDICKAIFDLIRRLFDEGAVWDDIAKAVVDLCDLFQVEDHTVCQGIVSVFKVRVHVHVLCS